jgi:hypothetical protein
MLQTNLNAKEIKAGASLPALLESLGYHPQRQTGGEMYYLSMLRDNDTKPSFAVNKEFNIWYDHGMAKGGNIIDFAMAYWSITFREALRRLSEYFPLSQMPDYGRLQTRRRHAQKLPHYRVQDIRPLGINPEITDYLKTRCVWEVSQSMLSEIYYFVEDEKGVRKPFFAAGWQNELGSWEVRNPWFKGCLGHKAITFISRDERSVSVFEGCFNYLSWQTDNPQSEDSILILNSAVLLESAIRKIKDFLEISVYFDRDDTGRLKSAELIHALPGAVDRSLIYREHNDYNEMIVKRTKRTFVRRP